MMVISETPEKLVIGQLNGNMNEKYLTYFEGDMLPNRDGLQFDTKYLMDLLGTAMKETGSNKEPHQVLINPTTNKQKYKYLLIGC